MVILLCDSTKPVNDKLRNVTYKENVAAYGLFHLTFALLDGTLTDSIASLLRCRNREIAISLFRDSNFGTRLGILQKMVSFVEGQHGVALDELRRVIKGARELSQWRNQHVHGRLVISGTTATLIDKKNGAPLPIDQQECEEKRSEAIRLTVDLERLVPGLLDNLEIYEKIDQIVESSECGDGS